MAVKGLKWVANCVAFGLDRQRLQYPLFGPVSQYFENVYIALPQSESIF